MDGTTIGQYRVVRRMGGGGMGVVYHAVDDVLERDVALKVLTADVADPEKRFRAEAVAIARLSHPGIANVYELFQHEGRWVMVMELVRGETLEQMVDRVGPLSPKRAAELCMQALLALAHAHRMGVVHRNLKPSNIMVAEQGVVKVMDFGIARIEGTERLTNDGYMMGTPAYMAPEQVSGHDIDGRANLYALGIVFYRLITGQLPFKGETPYEMAQSQLKDPPIPVHLVKPDVPNWAKDILDRALAKARDQRFQSADGFYEVLKRGIMEMSSGATRRSAPTEQMPRPAVRTDRIPKPLTGKAARPTPMRSRRAVAIWTALAASAAAIGAVAVIWLQPADVVTPVPNRQASSPVEPGLRIGTPDPTGFVDAPVIVAPPRREGGAKPGTSGAAPIAAFSNTKLLMIDGAKTSDRDVVLSFSSRQLTIVPPDGGAPLMTVPYARITKATYVHAREPRWDPEHAGPVEKIEVSGILGRARHWLVVQTKDSFVILRLDGNGWQRVLEAYESITSRPIARPLAP